MLFFVNGHRRRGRAAPGLWVGMALMSLVMMLTAADARAMPVVSDGLLRLHVVAHSDSETDQRVKGRVRDAIQVNFAPVLAGARDGAEGREAARAALEAMERCANGVLEAEGVPYRARVRLERAHFPQRSYQDTVTLPEGYYWAVRVLLGDAAGANWWCVLFPPLCLPGETGEVPEVRSWLWELLPESWQRCLADFWRGGDQP